MTVTSTTGFMAAGTTCGIKPSGAPDLALIATAGGEAVTAAGVFTSNKMTAAPVLICREHLAATGGKAAAVVLNSGNANACTGPQGYANTQAMAAHTARNLGVEPTGVFVCSTGTIGKPLPMDKIDAGIDALFKELSPKHGFDAVEAMMTTDLAPKSLSVDIEIDGKPVRITGLAKGSGMIEPNMATMLAFILTDANVEKHALQCALRAATDTSFNRISVDGDQ
nr:bifunctional ornithine acetyltransferase/N-acetylglutamate synthase [Actinomycetota bacterium]